MAKTPQWTVRETGAASGGPLIVAPRNADAPYRALSGLGATVRDLGKTLTAEARVAQERSRALQRATEASDVRLDLTRKFLDLRDELGNIPDPEERLRRWDAAQGEFGTQLESIPDPETRAAAQRYYDDDMRAWDAEVHGSVAASRLAQAERGLQNAAAMSLELRDLSLYEERVRQAAPVVGWTDQVVADEMDRMERLIGHEQAKDAVAARAASLPFDDAVAYLNSDAPFYGTAIDPQEKQKFLDAQMGLLTRQQAAAAQEARRVESVRETNGVAAIAAAYRDKLDLDATLKQMEAGALRPEDFNQAVQIAKKGPVTQNDPAVYAQVQDLLDGMARGAQTPQAVRRFALDHADRLTPAKMETILQETAQAFAPQSQALRDAVTRARSQLVTAPEAESPMMALLRAQNPDAAQDVDNQRARQWRLVNYLEDELQRYLRENPQATREDIIKKGRALEVYLRQQAPERQGQIIAAWETDATRPAGPVFVAQTPQQADQAAARYVDEMFGPAVPVGLESIWSDLTPEEQTDVRELLAQGVSVARILAEVGQ
jgi:hypothetical protein